MRHAIAIGVAGLVWAFANTAVAAAAKGVAWPASHVASVEVVEHDAHAPPAFTDMVRDDALKEAALFGADGAPIALRIEIDAVHFKNVMKAMLLGDENVAQGRVAVVDPATGQVLGTFKLWVTGERPNAGLRVLGALDPTGIVAMGEAAQGTDPAKQQVVMAENFAREVLRLTYGDTRSRAAHAAPPSSGAVLVSSAAPASAQPASLRSAQGPAQAAASSHSPDGAAASDSVGVTAASSLAAPAASAVARAP